MKKVVSYMVVLTLIMSSISLNVYAANYDHSIISEQETIYCEDGSYIVSEIREYNTKQSTRSVSTKNGSKTNTMYSASGKKLFSLTVHGTFTYNGSSAKATNASYSYTLDSSDYSFENGSAHCSGATAAATGTFKALLQSKTISTSLTCSKDGKLS